MKHILRCLLKIFVHYKSFTMPMHGRDIILVVTLLLTTVLSVHARLIQQGKIFNIHNMYVMCAWSKVKKTKYILLLFMLSKIIKLRKIKLRY